MKYVMFIVLGLTMIAGCVRESASKCGHGPCKEHHNVRTSENGLDNKVLESGDIQWKFQPRCDPNVK